MEFGENCEKHGKHTQLQFHCECSLYFGCNKTFFGVCVFRIRNGRELPEGGRYKVEATDSTYKLTIKEVWDIDDGEYTCQITNPYGQDSCTAKLKVQGS